MSRKNGSMKAKTSISNYLFRFHDKSRNVSADLKRVDKKRLSGKSCTASRQWIFSFYYLTLNKYHIYNSNVYINICQKSAQFKKIVTFIKNIKNIKKKKRRDKIFV